jgi:hypothetical protein
MMRRFAWLPVAAALLGAALHPAVADAPGFDLGRLVIVDTPYVPAQGQLRLSADLRSFGGREDNLYGGLSALYGLGGPWAGLLRGTVGNKETGTTAGGVSYPYGGRDVEAMVRWQTPRKSTHAVELGVCTPGGSQYNGTYLTTQVMVAHEMPTHTTLYFNPKAVFFPNFLATFSGGICARATDRLTFSGEAGGVIYGDNIYSRLSGTATRTETWAVRACYQPHAKDDSMALDLAWTNALGPTTATSIVAGRGGASAVMLGIHLKR